jgi:peptide/nickel transport system substrate-binding protein
MTLDLTRRRLMGAAAAAGALSFAGLPRPVRAADGVLTFGLSSYPPSFEPLQSNGTAAATVKLLIHRGLLSYAPDGSIRGELAESWAPAEDGSWTFTLREGMTWHDGRPVTSADVRYTIETGAAEGSTAQHRGSLQAIAAIETPDDRTVILRYDQPNAAVEALFAHYNMPIIPDGAEGESLIGAGPFMLDDRERGVAITLKANPTYYRAGLPKLAGVRIVVYADENLRVAALQAGDVDLIEYVPWQSMQAIEADPALALDAVDGPFMYLTFNGHRAPFDNPLVRRAVAHAINRQDIVDAAFFGRGSPLAHLPIAPASDFHTPEHANAWAYDPDRAKALLAEAGMPGGFSCTMLSTAQYGMHSATAEICQAYLSMVGINVTLDMPDWATRVQRGNAGEFDMAVMGTTTDTNDPDGLARIVDTSFAPSFVNSHGLSIPELEAQFVAGRATFDKAERQAAYRRMEEIAIEQAPVVGLAWRSQGYAMKTGVTGFTNLPGQLTFYSGLTLETVELG